MKKIILGILLLTTCAFHSFGQSILWNTPTTVAMGSMYSNVYPRLTLMTNDIPLVAWGSLSTDKVYTSQWTGTSFSTPITINPTGVIPFLASWAGAEIASSGDTAFVVFSTMVGEGGEIYSLRSVDGGQSFEDTVRVDQIGTYIARFPTVAVGLGGNPVVNFMRLNSDGSGAEYDVARSMNGGTSYLPSTTPSLGAPGEVCDCCPAAITTSGDKHVLMYRNNDNNIRDNWASFSTDGSANYTSSAAIDLNLWMLMACPSSGPSGIIVGDSLLSTWMSAGEVYIGSTNINDQQIGINRKLFQAGSGNENFPIIAGSGDTLGVIWENNASGSVDILFSYSVTGLSGLGVMVDTLTNTIAGNQTRPDLAFSNGKFHLVYRDGSNVHYLNGTIANTASLPETILATDLDFIAVQKDGAIEIKVQSNVKSDASIELVNSVGQKITGQKIQLNRGETTVTLPYNRENGIHYLVLTTKTGETLTRNILLNH